ncbi:hypothetical protein [Pseudooceanicola algae]|uniref:DUF695 domain-containing protein n=1 Tax=Pseudooceanicola algae TaxID=1537215 RepID=A0A418SG29_9RHOB|nr:hypothetical protein [Pseudooceanicola algae]QPM91630.1 hypothetical protein PSAL_028850 [Pseudooceanicola algae]
MLGFIFGRKAPFAPPEDWQDLQVPGPSGLRLTVNRALETWDKRFDFGVLLRIRLARPNGPDPGPFQTRLLALGAPEGRALLAAVLAETDGWVFYCYSVSLHEAQTLQEALTGEFPGPAVAISVERDNFWQVYRELLTS